ncbi:unnamed protein product [Phytomonas sp. EM1]|nr:unnamed protein product [Phytomonas sp. EM1]|eukprot:CCW62193.1 unnamed protein product [Phytomonas sp. isolate EM1]
MWPRDASAEEGRRLARRLRDWQLRRMQEEVNRENTFRVLSRKYGPRILTMPNLLSQVAEVSGYHIPMEEEDEPDDEDRKLLADVAMSLKHENRMQGLLAPVYDGPMTINIVAMPAQRNKPASLSCGTKKTDKDNNKLATNNDARLLGTFRQSLWLIHFKIYCCALHDEVEQRHGGHLRALVNLGGSDTSREISSTANGDNNSLSTDKSVFMDKRSTKCRVSEEDSILLAGVPCIPRPVLRLQQVEPPLQKPPLRSTPDLSCVQSARCWVGLFPSPHDLLLPDSLLKLLGLEPIDAAERKKIQLRMLETWNYLHKESVIARQAVKDVFHRQGLDADMKLNKDGFTKFVLQLLNLFFPTHLPQMHLDIANEEWIYRGTTENVGFETFFEKFFSLPFIFHRDLALVTEHDYAEWWCIVRICLCESSEAIVDEIQPFQCSDLFSESYTLYNENDLSSRRFSRTIYSPHRRRSIASSIRRVFSPASGRKNRRSASISIGRSLLAPLTNFTPEQIRTMHTFNFVAVPETNTLKKLRRASCSSRAETSVANATPSPRSARCVSISGVEPVCRLRSSRVGQLPTQDNPIGRGEIFHPPRSVSSSGRVDVLNVFAEGTRAAVAEQLQLESDLEAILKTSELYQRRHKRIQEDYQRAICRIENLCGSWTLYYGDGADAIAFCNLAEPLHANLARSPSTRGSGRDSSREVKGRANEDSYEDRLIAYVQDLPDEVFHSRILLRERFPTYEAYREERYRRGLLKMETWREESAASKVLERDTHPREYDKSVKGSLFPLPSPRFQSTRINEKIRRTSEAGSRRGTLLKPYKSPSNSAGGVVSRRGVFGKIFLSTEDSLDSGRLSSIVKSHDETMTVRRQSSQFTRFNETTAGSLKELSSTGNACRASLWEIETVNGRGSHSPSARYSRRSERSFVSHNNTCEGVQPPSLKSHKSSIKHFHVTPIEHANTEPGMNSLKLKNSRKMRQGKDDAAVIKTNGLANPSKGYRVFNLNRFLSTVPGSKKQNMCM